MKNKTLNILAKGWCKVEDGLIIFFWIIIFLSQFLGTDYWLK